MVPIWVVRITTREGTPSESNERNFAQWPVLEPEAQDGWACRPSPCKDVLHMRTFVVLIAWAASNGTRRRSRERNTPEIRAEIALQTLGIRTGCVAQSGARKVPDLVGRLRPQTCLRRQTKMRPQNPDARSRLEHLAGFEKLQFAARAALVCGRRLGGFEGRGA